MVQFREFVLLPYTQIDSFMEILPCGSTEATSRIVQASA